MGERGDAENERRSRAIVDRGEAGPVLAARPTLDQLAERVAQLEDRVAELDRRAQ
jgi:hypothetical protein